MDRYAAAFLTRASTADAIELVRRHAQAPMDVPIRRIDTPAIDAALSAVLNATPKTARRTLAVVALVFDYARVKGLDQDRANPAQWRGTFEFIWDKTPQKTHHRALPYSECPALFARLIAKDRPLRLPSRT